jgi:hypothetical protein
LPNADIIGTEERNKRKRDTNIEAGQAQLRAFETLKAAGLDKNKNLIEKLIKPEAIAKGNEESIKKSLLSASFDFIKGSPLFSQLTQQKSFEGIQRETLKRDDLGFLVEQIRGVKTTQPENRQAQADLIRALEALAEEFRNAKETANAQTNKEFNTNFPTTPNLFDKQLKELDSKISTRQRQIAGEADYRSSIYDRGLQDDTPTQANASIQRENRLQRELQNLQLQRNFVAQGGQGNVQQNANTVALNNNLTALSTNIQGLIESLTQVINVNNNAPEESPFATINITATGGDSEQTKQILAKITDALNSLNAKVNVIQRSTKTVIPPTTNNPFSNINNSSITL